MGGGEGPPSGGVLTVGAGPGGGYTSSCMARKNACGILCGESMVQREGPPCGSALTVSVGLSGAYTSSCMAYKEHCVGLLLD